jgi:hypothetical protein
MFVNPWCQSYYQKLIESGILCSSECGCPKPKEAFPILTVFDENLTNKLEVEPKLYAEVVASELDNILALAEKNIYSTFEKLDMRSLNDLFKSVEQPPYDTIVRLVIIPKKFEKQSERLFDNWGDKDGDRLMLWTADIVFVETDKDLVVAIGKDYIHGLKIEKVSDEKQQEVSGSA